MTFTYLLFMLVAAHAVCDFPLQGEYLAQAKNRNLPLGGYWPIALFSHSVIHGGAVTLLTGSVLLGALEAIAHGIADWMKCEGRISFHADQYIHLACKVVWASIWAIWL